jgi:Dyp-type peroxidase family
VSTVGAVPLPVAPEPQLELSDIQGIVLRSYRMAFLRALVLRVDDVTRTKTFLRALADGAPQPLRIQNAETWETKPKYCVNVGITADGLKALGVPDAVIRTFPPEFLEGPVARAAMVGDTGGNDPSNWMAPFGTDQVHILLMISAESSDVLESVTKQIGEAISGGATATTCPDGVLPPDHRAHFGYVDGISQPRIAGVSRQKADGSGATEFSDPMALVPPGAFVLGLPTQHPGLVYPMPAPVELGKNGSFAALRILEQDCAGFENFLDAMAASAGMNRELIAAKLCGRWRTGVPLSLSPDNPDPASVPLANWNQFDYSDDPAGKRCPLGSHIRRNNPRSTSVAGDGGERHRIMRRGLPYGPPFDPQNPNDGIARGLLGLFVCGNLRDQFEFLMKEWVNDGDFVGLGADRDPVLGNQPPEGGRFRIPNQGKPQTVLRGMPRFITTRGGAYCFLPSITGLRYLARED